MSSDGSSLRFPTWGQMPTPQPNKKKPEDLEVQACKSSVTQPETAYSIQMIMREAQLAVKPAYFKADLPLHCHQSGFNVALNSSPQGLSC